MSTTVLALVALSVLVAAFMQSTTGMGFALIVVPVFGILQPSLLPGGLLLMMLPLNAYVAWRERKAIDFSGVKWITAGRAAGTFGGLWVLVAVPLTYLNWLIGGSTIAAALATLVAPAFAPDRRAFVATGLFTGVTETATGIGGPPLAMVYQHSPVATLRASVALSFLIGEVISLLVLAVNGRITTDNLGALLWLMPALVVGTLASHTVHTRVNTRFLRMAVLVFAIGSGVFILIHG
ncbi:TSUP family transporter [Duganella sp. FT92W]|uniref:Probable membrane transporter protein n=1 Tax=Pseudoduganella rivuli TaxID=2666085 RepID=A0A7X2LSK9_9BURK|nr:TSUP family transporter [Pseudoduganella rivuli]